MATHNITENLDFSAPTPEQNVISFSQLTEIPTRTSLPRKTTDLVPLEFRIEKAEPYVDLSETYVYLTFKVKRVDGTSLAENEFVTTANNLGYTMWQDVEIHIGGQQITQNQALYPFMSCVHCLTKTSSKYKETAMRSALWYADTAGMMDMNDFTKADESPANEGSIKRAAKIQKSDIVEMYSRLLTDFGVLRRLIPSYTDILIRLRPADANLCLIAGKNEPTNPLTIEILDAKLYTTKVFLTPSAHTKYDKILQSKGFDYDIQRYVTRTKLVNKGEQNLNFEVTEGRLPRRMYIYQVLQSAYNGDIQRNIFNFQMFNLKSLRVFVNDRLIPSNVSMYLGTEDKARMYLSSLHAMDKKALTVDMFVAGYFLVAIDLTADKSAQVPYQCSEKKGSVRLNITYDKPQDEAIIVLVTYELDAGLHIDKNRSPTWKY